MHQAGHQAEHQAKQTRNTTLQPSNRAVPTASMDRKARPDSETKVSRDKETRQAKATRAQDRREPDKEIRKSIKNIQTMHPKVHVQTISSMAKVHGFAKTLLVAHGPNILHQDHQNDKMTKLAN